MFEITSFPASSSTMDQHPPTDERPDSLRDLIIRRALEAFVHGGYSRTSTDTISRMLGISKKTLYKVFPSKEDILRSVVRLATRSIEERTEAVYNDHARSVADRLAVLVTQISPIYARIRSPQLLLDFQRAAPSVWNELREWRIARYVALRGLIAEGVQRGEIRDDISIDDVINVYAILVDKCMDYATLEESSISSLQLYRGLMELLLHGLFARDQSLPLPTEPAPLDRTTTLQHALDLFNQFGYTRTSADDIARSCGISKRTLYEQYAKKSHIATTILLDTARDIDRRCDALAFDTAATYHANVHVLITTYACLLGGLSSTFLDDLAIALPRQHAAFMSWRRGSFEYHLSRAITAGKTLGLITEAHETPVLIALVRITLENILLSNSTAKTLNTALSDRYDVIALLYDGILQRRERSQLQPTR